MRFVTGAGGGSVVAFTSAAEAEGKTTVAANHAVTSAQAGYSTILVDADLRKPRVHQVLGIPNGVGLSHLLTGQVSIHEAMKQPLDRLAVITAGPMPPNPSELLGSEQFANLLSELSQLADVIVLDAAPVLPVADGYEVACLADATVCVVNAARSRGRAVRAAVAGLRQVEARIAGAVLTEVDPRNTVYGHYYYEYYGPEERVELAPLRPPASVQPDEVETALWDSGRDNRTSARLAPEPRDRA
jgi:capsular exopolysaccharide synthesis family protein